MIANPGVVSRTIDAVRDIVHSATSGFLPITYTPSEVRRRIDALDPKACRKNPRPNGQTRRRILAIARELDFDTTIAQQALQAAYKVDLRQPILPNDQPDLPSPMCSEDKYTTYVLTRLLEPSIAVETGVAHGVSSAYILSAMSAAGTGSLISIEKSTDPRVGGMVPDNLKGKWRLLRGDSLTLIQGVCQGEVAVDMFIHDSLHTYRHMRCEFEAAWPFIRAGGLLVAHDICHTNAFDFFIRAHAAEVSSMARGVNLGVLRKR